MEKLKESIGTRIMSIILSWIIVTVGMIADYYQIYPNNHKIGVSLLIVLPLAALLYSIFRGIDYITYYGVIKKAKKEKSIKNNEIIRQWIKSKEQSQINFDRSTTTLRYNAGPDNFKRNYEMYALPIINNARIRAITISEMALLNKYIQDGQFTDYFDKKDIEMVRDRFYKNYPSIKSYEESSKE